MERNYRRELDQIRLSQENKAALVQSLTGKKNAANGPRHILRGSLVAAALVFLLGLTATAAVAWEPLLGEHFGNTPGYQQSSVVLGASDTQNGWTAVVTDCVGDDQTMYFGVEIIAPEGTVLDQKEYFFEEWDIEFPGIRYWYGRISGGGGFTMLEDEDPADNRLTFLLKTDFFPEEDTVLNGETVKLRLGKLGHFTVFREETSDWDTEYDTQAVWTIQTSLSFPDNTIRLEPKLPVKIFDAEATITSVELSPINVFVKIEGDSLKGHHAWMPKTAPDGWYGCDNQEITLYTKDGTAISLTEAPGSGSGCSGGEDMTEPGSIRIVRRFDTLMDLSEVDHLEVCGVSIPLHP